MELISSSEVTIISTILARGPSRGKAMLAVGMATVRKRTRGSGKLSRSSVLTCRVIKSGTDFRDLSSANLELTDTPAGSIRRKIISSLTGKHHYILPSNPSSPAMNDMLSELLSSVEGTLQKPVCFTLTPFDARSEVVRTKETGLGNWVADVLIHAYAESLIEGGHQDFFEKQKKEGEVNAKGNAAAENDEMRKRKGGADAVIICGGTLRGDSQYGPGKITLGDILGECMQTPFDSG
jgi:hypothetical protein